MTEESESKFICKVIAVDVSVPKGGAPGEREGFQGFVELTTPIITEAENPETALEDVLLKLFTDAGIATSNDDIAVFWPLNTFRKIMVIRKETVRGTKGKVLSMLPVSDDIKTFRPDRRHRKKK